MKRAVFSILVFSLMMAGCDGDNGSERDINVVLITIDALRADHLSCYGYERNTSPNIDMVADRGYLFTRAIAPSSYTVPSMASLFTSTYPSNHGVLYGRLAEIFPNVFKNFETDVNHAIPDELPTLADILGNHGYTTIGVSANLLLDESTGFASGFDHFEHLVSLPANDVNNGVFSFADTIRKADKYFLWVHYMDPHFPYHPREPWIDQYTSRALTSKFDLHEKTYMELMKYAPKLENDPQALTNLVALYDSEINFVDDHIGELIDDLDLGNNTLIIITSDHGEEFLEHDCLTHGNNLYNSTIHIPLIIKLPNSAGKESVEHCVNLVDILPTILQLLNIDPAVQALGTSVFDGERVSPDGDSLIPERDAMNRTFSEISKENELKTVITREYKYIHDYGHNREFLYDMASDPGEHINLINKRPKTAALLREMLTKWTASQQKYSTGKSLLKLAPEETEKLEALGYVENHTAVEPGPAAGPGAEEGL
jgi:arylsulfatase A-like enzyme